MGVSFKQGLVRAIAFLVVGTAVVISTQILKGDDPAAAANRITQMVRSTVSVFAPEPVSTTPTDVTSIEPTVDPQNNVSFAVNPSAEPSIFADPKVLTFAASQANAPTLDVPERCNKTDVSTGSTVIGDKMQLRFFAKVGIPKLDDASGLTASIESVAFERLDLSGIYEISEDGTAALPLIGRLELGGRTLSCVEALVAGGLAAQDASVSAVTAAFASRLPVTVSGAVRSPGSYIHTPGMTVNRLLNLAGATLSEGPITPQDFESLIAKHEEISYRQVLAVLELARLNATIAGQEEISVDHSDLARVSETLVSPLILAETAALRRDLSVNRTSDQRTAVAIAGLKQKFEDISKQLELANTQTADLQLRSDEMNSFKTRGLIRGSQIDVLLSNLMELNRIKMQLHTDQSNLTSQIALAEEDNRLTNQLRQQDLSRRAGAVSGEIGLYEVQLAAVESQLAKHGTGDGTDAVPLVVSIQRTEVNGAYRIAATLDTIILPGDMMTVSLSPSMGTNRITAANDETTDARAIASGLIEQ